MKILVVLLLALGCLVLALTAVNLSRSNAETVVCQNFQGQPVPC